MAHPLVEQLRFTRHEFERGLGSVQDPEAQQQFGTMNCISWLVAHLAWQEQRYWLEFAQGRVLLPELNELAASGKPACQPKGAEIWESWRQVVQASDPWLDGLTAEVLLDPITSGRPSIGNFLLRVTYHYWFHLGEGMAVRQMLGHKDLPGFVGNIDGIAPYRPESTGEQTRVSAAEFVEKVRTARSKIFQPVEKLPKAALLLPVNEGGWTVKDMIAHLTWHEREMVGMLSQKALKGSDLWFEPLEKRNQAIYEQNRDRSLDEVLEQARDVYRRLDEALQGLEDDDLHDPGRYAEMPPDWRPWQILAENTYEHYEAHLPWLQDWVNKNSFDE